MPHVSFPHIRAKLILCEGSSETRRSLNEKTRLCGRKIVFKISEICLRRSSPQAMEGYPQGQCKPWLPPAPPGSHPTLPRHKATLEKLRPRGGSSKRLGPFPHRSTPGLQASRVFPPQGNLQEPRDPTAPHASLNPLKTQSPSTIIHQSQFCVTIVAALPGAQGGHHTAL